jgi:hypothetical protein
VTAGIITQLRDRLAPEIFLMRDSGCTSIGAELGEVDLRPGQQIEAAAGQPPQRAAAGGGALSTPLT